MSMCESEQQSQILMDSEFHQKFQNKTSSFQVHSQQNDEPIDYEKLLEAMTQAQITHNRDRYNGQNSPFSTFDHS